MTMSDNDDEDSNSSQYHVAQRMHAILHPRMMAGGESAEDEPAGDMEEVVLPTPRAHAPLDGHGSDDNSDAYLDSIINAATAGSNMTTRTGGTNTTGGTNMTGSITTPATAAAAAAAAAEMTASPTAAGNATSAETATSNKRRVGTTTARSVKSTKAKKAKQDKNVNRCKKNAQVKVTRGNLYHILTDPDQKKVMEADGDHVNYHGTILSGTQSQGYQTTLLSHESLYHLGRCFEMALNASVELLYTKTWCKTRRCKL